MNSKTPWELFELDSSSATLADLKVAYAAKLKIHRPDQDPEGFQRVREAYESLKLQIDSEDHASFDYSDYDDLALFGEASIEENWVDANAIRHRELPEALSQLNDEIQALEEFDSDRSIKLFERGQAYCKDYPSHLPDWGLISMGVFYDQEPQWIFRFFLEEDVVWELEHDCPLISQRLVSVLVDQEGYQSSKFLAEQLLAKKDRLNTLAAAQIYLQLAQDVGFAYHDLGEDLISAAFEILPPDTRQYQIQNAQYCLSLGRTLWPTISRPDMKFWQQRILDYNNEELYDWTSDEGQEQLDGLREESSFSQSFLNAIQPYVPQAFHREIRTRVEHSNYQTDSSGDSSISWGWILWIGFVLLKMLVLSSQCGSRSSSYSHPIDPPSFSSEDLRVFRVDSDQILTSEDGLVISRYNSVLSND